MSRSRKHSPIAKIFGQSDKKDKRACNRKLRRVNKTTLAKHGDDVPFMVKDEAMDLWQFNSEGKHFLSKRRFTNEGKWAQETNKIMRK